MYNERRCNNVCTSANLGIDRLNGCGVKEGNEKDIKSLFLEIPGHVCSVGVPSVCSATDNQLYHPKYSCCYYINFLNTQRLLGYTFHISVNSSSTVAPGNMGRPHTISYKMQPHPLRRRGKKRSERGREKTDQSNSWAWERNMREMATHENRRGWHRWSST